MTKIITPILFLIFSLQSYGQDFNNNSSIPEGNKLVIEALDYSNDIDKYYFDKDKIDELALFLSENPEVKIEVNCFSDFLDASLMNLMSTADQAAEIRNYLVTKGINGSRISIVGNGDMFPIVNEYDLSQLSKEEQIIANNKNRRIEIVFLSNDLAAL